MFSKGRLKPGAGDLKWENNVLLCSQALPICLHRGEEHPQEHARPLKHWHLSLMLKLRDYTKLQSPYMLLMKNQFTYSMAITNMF